LPTRKYSSASTVEIDNNIPSKEILEQLIQKYNLFVYLGNLAIPPPEYHPSDTSRSNESTQASNDTTSRTATTAVVRGSDFICVTMNLEHARPADNIHGISNSGPVGHSLETLKGCCGVPARLSGFFSWCIQLIILLISVVVTALIFVHIGGYGYFLSSSNNNETEIINTLSNDNLSDIFVNIDPQMLANETMKETIQVVRILEGNETEYQMKEIPKIYQGPFEQITEVNLKVGKFVISLLPVLRTINVIYIIFCVLWLASLGCLLLSLKLELLDLVMINCGFLVIAIIAFFVQSLVVGILIFYEKTLIWQRMLVIGGTVGGFLFCFIFGIVALWLLLIWYKYIDYSYNRKDAVGNLYLTSSTPRLLRYIQTFD
jgi:hypothetical protein